MAEVRQMHAYDCALRLILAAALVALGLAAVPAHAEPETCPTTCDRIPNTAWIDPAAIPLNAVYSWPAPATVASALTGAEARFRIESLCASPPVPQGARVDALAARATVVKPDGQWQLQVQVLHWRGDTWRGGQLAAAVLDAARTTVRGCQRGAPAQSPSITTDEPNRLAAVISGPVVMRTYLSVHPWSSTISELTLWSASPPQTDWPVLADTAVFDALTSPLCVAYLGSCDR